MSTQMQDNTQALAELANKAARLTSYSSNVMPIIALTSISFENDGVGDRPTEEHPHRFSFKVIGGGSLREGDEIQLCVYKLATRARTGEDEDGNVICYPRRRKYKLRCFHKVTIEESFLQSGMNYIDLYGVLDELGSYEDSKIERALCNTPFNTDLAIGKVPPISYIYLRIRRATQDNHDAIFSNVIPIAKQYIPNIGIHYYY
jgi:hypothetical protein